MLSKRFFGAATSVTRRPKLPLISTTSPRATILSPTIKSTGSEICRTQVENLAQRHLPAAEAQRSIKLHIEQQLNSGTDRGMCGQRRRGGRLGLRRAHLIPHQNCPGMIAGRQLKGA